MSRRHRGPLEWALRIVLAVLLITLGLVVGGLIRGNFGPWKTTAATTTTTSTSRPAAAPAPGSPSVHGTPDEEVAIHACSEVGALQSELAGAVSDLDQSGLYVPVQTAPGAPFTVVIGLRSDATSLAPYFVQGAKDATALYSAWQSYGSEAETFAQMQADTTAIASDCSGFGYATGTTDQVGNS